MPRSAIAQSQREDPYGRSGPLTPQYPEVRALGPGPGAYEGGIASTGDIERIRRQGSANRFARHLELQRFNQVTQARQRRETQADQAAMFQHYKDWADMALRDKAESRLQEEQDWRIAKDVWESQFKIAEEARRQYEWGMGVLERDIKFGEEQRQFNIGQANVEAVAKRKRQEMSAPSNIPYLYQQTLESLGLKGMGEGDFYTARTVNDNLGQNIVTYVLTPRGQAIINALDVEYYAGLDDPKKAARSHYEIIEDAQKRFGGRLGEGEEGPRGFFPTPPEAQAQEAARKSRVADTLSASYRSQATDMMVRALKADPANKGATDEELRKIAEEEIDRIAREALPKDTQIVGPKPSTRMPNQYGMP